MWSKEKAVFVRVADEIADDIRRGALRAGDRLPSTRAFAAQRGLARNTVVAAYDELAAQGWVSAHGPGGTRVSREIPERTARTAPRATPRGMAPRTGFELRTVPSPYTGILGQGARYHLSAGVPDPRLFPTAAYARAYRRALRSRGARAALDYAEAPGAPRLREALAQLVRTARGIPAGPENLLVTRGSQGALDLAARLLVRPGDAVGVEELGYRPAWRAFEEAGARLVPIALDAHGILPASIPAGVRAVYLTPHHQYPTTVLLAPNRRLELLARARAGGFAIVEDDYDHEFHYDGRPVAPLAAADRGAAVVYVGTLSKVLAPGLRIGFVVAAERVIEQLSRLRTSIDRQGDHVTELAIAELIDDGELARHARKARLAYLARRDALLGALDRELRGVVEAQAPAGGITLWARVDPGVDLEAWRRRALERGVAFSPARDFDIAGRARPYVRLAYARHDPGELADAVRRLRLAL